MILPNYKNGCLNVRTIKNINEVHLRKKYCLAAFNL